jgi:hypothetical protein
VSSSVHRRVALLATAVVVATVVWGLLEVGLPQTRRLERLDERRVEDLRALVRAIQARVRDPGRPGRLARSLPRTLEEVAAQARDTRLALRDPGTGEPYLYRVTGETTYELCATFAQACASAPAAFWDHPAGRHCFRIDALLPP